MKILKRFVGLLLLVCMPFSVLAEGPKEIVESVVEQMKSQRSPTPILDHVHWPTAYKSFPAEEKRAMNVESPEELKAHMKSVMANPKDFMKKQMNTRIGGMPKQQQDMMKQMMTNMMSQMDAQISEMRRKIGETEYQISNEQINGSAASVDIAANLDGKVRNTTVQMEKIEGRWYFPTIDFAKENSAKVG